MDSKGWIKLDRNLLDHPLWKEKPFSKGQAWIDILFLAEWKAQYVRVGGKKKKVNPGQCWVTLNALAQRWGWSKETVRRFLRKLERDGSVSLLVTEYGTRLTVGNWRLYQRDVSASETESETVGEFPTIYIKNEEERTDPFGEEEDGMTEEEWNEFIRVQSRGS